VSDESIKLTITNLFHNQSKRKRSFAQLFAFMNYQQFRRITRGCFRKNAFSGITKLENQYEFSHERRYARASNGNPVGCNIKQTEL
jgi:hypothetical protein